MSFFPFPFFSISWRLCSTDSSLGFFLFFSWSFLPRPSFDLILAFSFLCVFPLFPCSQSICMVCTCFLFLLSPLSPSVLKVTGPPLTLCSFPFFVTPRSDPNADRRRWCEFFSPFFPFFCLLFFFFDILVVSRPLHLLPPFCQVRALVTVPALFFFLWLKNDPLSASFLLFHFSLSAIHGRRWHVCRLPLHTFLFPLSSIPFFFFCRSLMILNIRNIFARHGLRFSLLSNFFSFLVLSFLLFFFPVFSPL